MEFSKIRAIAASAAVFALFLCQSIDVAADTRSQVNVLPDTNTNIFDESMLAELSEITKIAEGYNRNISVYYNDSVITGDTYETGANDEWHLRLLNLLDKLPVDNYQVVISNHSNDLYDEYMNTHFGKWYKIRIGSRTNNCASGNNCKKKSTVGEYLYSNFKIDI